MKIVRFMSAAGPRIGLADKSGVYDLWLAAQARGLGWADQVFRDQRSFLLAGEPVLELAQQLVEWAAVEPQPIERTRLLAPHESSSKILAHVVNYHEHGKEGNIAPPGSPFFFYKSSSSVVAHGDPILTHSISAKMDHEVELAVIIGRTARNVRAEDAYGYVAGYTVLNDVSYRDLQMIESDPGMAKRYGKDWTQGKGLDNACPIGPWMVTRDEMPTPYPLEIRCTVNGEIRQKSNTRDMIFDVPAMLADITRSMTLYPGDIISTGTCEGGGVGTGKWLRPGDVVECYVERIGTLSNVVRAAEWR